MTNESYQRGNMKDDENLTLTYEEAWAYEQDKKKFEDSMRRNKEIWNTKFQSLHAGTEYFKNNGFKIGGWQLVTKISEELASLFCELHRSVNINERLINCIQDLCKELNGFFTDIRQIETKNKNQNLSEVLQKTLPLVQKNPEQKTNLEPISHKSNGLSLADQEVFRPYRDVLYELSKDSMKILEPDHLVFDPHNISYCLRTYPSFFGDALKVSEPQGTQKKRDYYLKKYAFLEKYKNYPKNKIEESKMLQRLWDGLQKPKSCGHC